MRKGMREVVGEEEESGLRE
jgi:hypothetical protein